MDSSIPGIPNSPLPTTAVFADNVQDLLNAGALNVKPTGIIAVNSIDDVVNPTSGVTTLRDAINKANADSGEDLIVFDRSLFSTAQTITLKLGELDITHSLDIIAPRDTLTGADLVTVSGNQASRVFEIESGATVTLSGLIVADGTVTGDNGGGIKNAGTLTVDKSIVRNNTTKDVTLTSTIVGGRGGAIYSRNDSGNANLTVLSSTISSNSAAEDGGGIYSLGTTTLSSSTIGNNSGAVSGIGSGGGISSFGTITINNSILNGNSAYIGGGLSADGTSTINNSTISSNSTISNGDGGGILSVGISTINNSTISSNSAFNGGGISASGVGTVSTINNSTITSNSASNAGGGVFTGFTKINNTTIRGNSAKLGGGIFNQGGNTIYQSTISDNSATIEGGGICNIGAGSPGSVVSITVDKSTISGNSATHGNGGGIYNGTEPNTTSIFTVTNSTISGNWASQDGGGICNLSDTSGALVPPFRSNLTLTNSTISGNWAGDNGGGIYKGYKDPVMLLFSTVTQNQAANGGGVYQDEISPSSSAVRGDFKVRNTIIAANLNTLEGVNPDVSGTFTSNGYNLIGDGTGSTGFDETIGDLVGTSHWVIDPRLAPLDFYGGPTQTIALLPGSPAINAGDPTVLPTDPTTDQRGRLRVRRGRADIGAFESSLKK